MKQIISARSNAFYTQENYKNEFELKPHLELVIIYLDGKDYKFSKKELVSSAKLSEVRMLVSPEMLQMLITDLQLHQKKLESIRKNADQLNSLLRHISEVKDLHDYKL